MEHSKWIGLVLALSLHASNALAQGDTGKMLLDVCQGWEQWYSREGQDQMANGTLDPRSVIGPKLNCEKYIGNVAMGIKYQVPGSARIVCRPELFNDANDVRVVIDFLKRNPELLDQSAKELAMKAFIEAYPCKPRASLPARPPAKPSIDV